MVLVPLASLVYVDDEVPGVQVETAAPADDPGLDRSGPAAASRSRSVAPLPADDVTTTTTEPPTTTTAAPPTTVRAAAAPTTTHTHPPTTVKPTTTTAKPTTTTAKPTTTTAKPTTTTAKPTTTTAAPNRQEGDASYYSPSDPAECAHRTLPFGTILTVTSLENGASTTCRVGDRGPFIEGRIVDLSQERFAELAPLSDGVVRVRIEW